MTDTVERIAADLSRLLGNDIPHIQSRLSSLEMQGRITLALVVGLVLALVAGAISIIVGGS